MVGSKDMGLIGLRHLYMHTSSRDFMDGRGNLPVYMDFGLGKVQGLGDEFLGASVLYTLETHISFCDTFPN